MHRESSHFLCVHLCDYRISFEKCLISFMPIEKRKLLAPLFGSQTINISAGTRHQKNCTKANCEVRSTDKTNIFVQQLFYCVGIAIEVPNSLILKPNIISACHTVGRIDLELIIFYEIHCTWCYNDDEQTSLSCDDPEDKKILRQFVSASGFFARKSDEVRSKVRQTAAIKQDLTHRKVGAR